MRGIYRERAWRMNPAGGRRRGGGTRDAADHPSLTEPRPPRKPEAAAGTLPPARDCPPPPVSALPGRSLPLPHSTGAEAARTRSTAITPKHRSKVSASGRGRGRMTYAPQHAVLRRNRPTPGGSLEASPEPRDARERASEGPGVPLPRRRATEALGAARSAPPPGGGWFFVFE
jgi:hypothetical protein